MQNDTFIRLKILFKKIMGDENIDIENITLDSKIREDLGMNSIGILYLVLAIEEEFNISMHNEKLEDFITVKDVIEFIDHDEK